MLKSSRSDSSLGAGLARSWSKTTRSLHATFDNIVETLETTRSPYDWIEQQTYSQTCQSSRTERSKQEASSKPSKQEDPDDYVETFLLAALRTAHHITSPRRILGPDLEPWEPGPLSESLPSSHTVLAARTSQEYQDHAGAVSRLDILVDARADVNRQDRHGWTPLLCAVACPSAHSAGHWAVVARLLERLANPTPPLHRGCLDPSHCCKGRSCKQTFRGDRLETCTRPLHLAVELHEHEVCSMLLEVRAEPNAIDGLGRTPLAILVGQLLGDYPINQKLLRRVEKPLNRSRSSGSLHVSRCSGSLPLVDPGEDAAESAGLLAVRMISRARSSAKRSALDARAAAILRDDSSKVLDQDRERIVRTMKALLQSRAELAARGAATTPLHEAAKLGKLMHIQALIAFKADVDARDERNKTALELVQDKLDRLCLLRNHSTHHASVKSVTSAKAPQVREEVALETAARMLIKEQLCRRRERAEEDARWVVSQLLVGKNRRNAGAPVQEDIAAEGTLLCFDDASKRVQKLMHEAQA